MNILDTHDKITEIDKSGMYQKIFDFPEQIEQAIEIGNAVDINAKTYPNIQNIILAGMGGSAIGGDLVRAYLGDELNIPFYVCRNYDLPNFASDNTLVIVSSYSGNTEETLSAMKDAIKRGCKITCLTSGGEVAWLAEKTKYPRAVLPPGYPPRAALGFSFIPLLITMSKLGFGKNPQKDIEELIAGLKASRARYSVGTITEENPAKLLAAKLHNKIPVIYSGPDRIDAIGTRWKGQICENAEMLAFCNVFPEFNHNELVGWHILGEFKKLAIVVYLRDSEDRDEIKDRMDAVRTLLSNENIEIVDVFSHGDFRLGRMFSLIQLGDFASFYLAILNQVDPTPVKAIDYLKDQLAKI